MKPISPATMQLLERLAAQPGPIARLLGRAPSASRLLLDQVVAASELESALTLLPIALDSRGLHREDVLGALDALVRAAPSAALVWLEQRARALSPWRSEAWAHDPAVTPERVAALGPEPASAAGIASLHHSGWVRQRAVELLATSRDPLAVGFLLLRVNDWVGAVAGAARSALEARIAGGDLPSFVPWLDLAFRLEQARRNDLGSLVQHVRTALAAGSGVGALKAGCSSGTRAVRRRCIGIAFEARTFDLRPIVRDGLEDPDPVVRKQVAKAVGRVFEGPELQKILDQMLANRSPSVRYSALEILWERSAEGSRAIQERFLMDPHPHVRGTARWFLKSVAGVDIAGLYRAALPALPPRELAGAIEGLGEVGAAEDAARIAPFLRHERARVRAAALSALGKLGAAPYREAIIEALSDRSARVSRRACEILLRGPPVDPERLAYAALRARSAHERRNAIELAHVHDYWTAGLLLLRIARGGAPEAASRAAAALRTWEARYNRIFTHPTAAQAEALKAAIAALDADRTLQVQLQALVPSLEIRLRCTTS